MAVRVGIIGAGVMGRWHLRAANRAGGMVVGIHDLAVDRAGSLARGRVPACATVEELLRLRPEVIHICTPVESHVELALAALAADCHLVIEKPIAPTLPATERLLTRAAETNRLVVPVHQFVFQRGVQEILARRAELGALRHIEFTTASAGAEVTGAPNLDALALEISPHSFSLARACLGGPVGHLDWRLERAAPGEWRFGATTASGCLLSNRISLGGRPTVAAWQVVGDRGTAHADLFHGFATFEPGTASRRYKIARPVVTGAATAVAGMANLFHRAARGEQAYPGLRELLKRVYAASRGGTLPFGDDEIIDVATAVAEMRRQLP